MFLRTVNHKRLYLVSFLVIMFSFAGCASAPPSNVDNLCELFLEKPSWYRAAKKSAARWEGPLYLPMAIMYQESSFRKSARPPMQYFLGFIPTGRASDAYGYSQALKSTWAQYQKEVGSRFKNRDSFASAYDFVQWYMHKTHTINGVSKWDSYAQYLNYHEGQGGYSRGSHQNKAWLLSVAKRVEQRSTKYATQLSGCTAELDKKKSWF